MSFYFLKFPSLAIGLVITGFEEKTFIGVSFGAFTFRLVSDLLSSVEVLPRAVDFAFGTVNQFQLAGGVHLDAPFSDG
jgi:hypothetical protein